MTISNCKLDRPIRIIFNLQLLIVNCQFAIPMLFILLFAPLEEKPHVGITFSSALRARRSHRPASLDRGAGPGRGHEGTGHLRLRGPESRQGRQADRLRRRHGAARRRAAITNSSPPPSTSPAPSTPTIPTPTPWSTPRHKWPKDLKHADAIIVLLNHGGSAVNPAVKEAIGTRGRLHGHPLRRRGQQGRAGQSIT